MKPVRLTSEEIEILDDKSDIPILEIIKGLSLEELNYFGEYSPKDLKYYNSEQNNWLAKEKYLIAARKGSPEVSPLELVEDIQRNHNPERYRAYFVLKYPNKVFRKSEEVAVV